MLQRQIRRLVGAIRNKHGTHSSSPSCSLSHTACRGMSISAEVTDIIRGNQTDVQLSDDGRVLWHGIDIDEVAKTFGTPLKLTYIPKVSQNIEACQNLFQSAFDRHGYRGKYFNCYCTKSNHSQFVLEEVLRTGSGLEFSSFADLEILRFLEREGLVNKGHTFESLPLLCNGYKPDAYVSAIVNAHASGFRNILPILDSTDELDKYLQHAETLAPTDGDGNSHPLRVGIRIQTTGGGPTPTSRFGMPLEQAKQLCEDQISSSDGTVELKMLHFFVQDGIADSMTFWEQLTNVMDAFVELKQQYPSLDCLNIGGGMPHQSSFLTSPSADGSADKGNPEVHMSIVDRIVSYVMTRCRDAELDEPHLFTEFGTYTVADSAINIFGIKAQKQQPAPHPPWYLIDSSFITTMPDTWGKKVRFDCLPLNHLKSDFQRVTLGGLTCDADDFYNAVQHGKDLRLPIVEHGNSAASSDRHDQLRIAFFNTGAYQDNLAGYGGLKHCLLGSPQHLVARVLRRTDDEGSEAGPRQSARQTNQTAREASVVVAMESTDGASQWHVPLSGDFDDGNHPDKLIEISSFSPSQDFESMAHLLGYGRQERKRTQVPPISVCDSTETDQDCDSSASWSKSIPRYAPWNVTSSFVLLCVYCS